MNENQLNKIIELAKEYKVTKLIQFGSSLNSENFNDFDFACDGIYDKNFFKFGANLEKTLDKPVDLIPLKPSSIFTEYISKNGKLIYDSSIN